MLFPVVGVFVVFISLISAFALPTTSAAVSMTPPQPTQPATPTGPICTLVDGGESGGTFCNIWTGGGSLTDTNWVSTVTPPWLSSKLSSASDSASTTAIPLPDPEKCGEVGEFEITFDDLPAAGIPANATSGPPIFNPAFHFFWGASWTYGPPPDVPYQPNSGPRLGHSVAKANSTVEGSPHSGIVPNKGFGAGPRHEIDAYWFNITSAYAQCDFTGAADGQDCVLYASPWHYDPATHTDRVQGQAQAWVQKKCVAPPCHLNKINFGVQFTILSAISFYGVIEGRIVDFYMDSLQMGWFNNTCEAGLQRISSRK